LSAKRRVLLTGAGGFIGNASIEPLLAAGYEVHAVLSPKSTGALALAARLPSVIQRRADLLDRTAIEALVDAVRPSHLLHFAWVATPGLYWQSEDNTRWLAASKALLRAFHSRGGSRAVVAGSCAEYDWSEGGICHETGSRLAAGATNRYAASKIELKCWLDEFAGTHGLSSAWGRLFFQYGPGEPRQRLVASVIVALLEGHEALCTHGRQIRSFLHVADVGAAFAALLDSDVRGAVNVGSGERISIAELLERLARQMGRPDLLKLGARAAPPGEPAVLLPDIGRLRDEVRFRPKWTLDAGLADAVRWWREAIGGDALAGDAPARGLR
jgi:nucleoside-diphosphate-sugar epimerase